MTNSLDSAVVAAALKAMDEAFPARPFPRDAALTEGGRWVDKAGALHVYDDPESQQVSGFFAGKVWKQATGEALLRWRYVDVAMTHLTPRARAYYLPGFMTAFLTVPLDAVTFAVLEVFIRALTPPAVLDAEDARQWGGAPDARSEPQKQAMDKVRADAFQVFVDALNDAQKAAVALFLEAVEPPLEESGLANPATTALDGFWRRYRQG